MDLARFVSGVCARLQVPTADVTLFWTGIRCTCQHVCGQWIAQAETQRLSQCRALLKEGRARTRKGRSWAFATAETWWCFTGQAPTLWPVLFFLPGAANFIWLRPSGWMSWLKLAGVAVCSQCLCWFEAVAPWRSQPMFMKNIAWPLYRWLSKPIACGRPRLPRSFTSSPGQWLCGPTLMEEASVLWRAHLCRAPGYSSWLREVFLSFYLEASSSNLSVSQYPKII